METLAEDKKESLSTFDKILEIDYCIQGETPAIVEYFSPYEQCAQRKKMFLKYYRRSFGVITECCQKVGITRQCFYLWKKTDPEFMDAIREVDADKLNVAEDVLWKGISVDRDTSCARYYLDRRHPDYRPKSDLGIVPGVETAEDIFDREAKERELENKNKNNEQSRLGQSVGYRKQIED